MKKIFMAIALCLMCAFSFSANAENLYGYTTDLMIWNGYSWESTGNGAGINVTVTETTVYIASTSPQSFTLYDVSDLHMNNSNHLQYTARAYDENGSRCSIRFVFRDDIEAPLQMYIYYNNISYVYNIRLVQRPGYNI